MNRKIIGLGLVLSIAFIGFLVLLARDDLERRFTEHETEFQRAADAFIAGEKYLGATHWLYAKGPGEGARYLPFHMGDDFRRDYYKPRIVYVHSDNLRGVHLCSFDGRMIKKIKPRWYICRESRF